MFKRFAIATPLSIPLHTHTHTHTNYIRILCVYTIRSVTALFLSIFPCTHNNQLCSCAWFECLPFYICIYNTCIMFMYHIRVARFLQLMLFEAFAEVPWTIFAYWIEIKMKKKTFSYSISNRLRCFHVFDSGVYVSSSSMCTKIRLFSSQFWYLIIWFGSRVRKWFRMFFFKRTRDNISCKKSNHPNIHTSFCLHCSPDIVYNNGIVSPLWMYECHVKALKFFKHFSFFLKCKRKTLKRHLMSNWMNIDGCPLLIIYYWYWRISQ